MSSMRSRTCGNRSLTGVPQVPPGRNFHGEARVLPLLLNWVGSAFILNGWPSSRSSRGLGSKVSTCEGPPSMKRKMTLRALGRWCGGRSASPLAAGGDGASAP